MPTLDNYTRYTSGVRKYSGRINKTFSVTLGTESLVREGTGRRPKPKDLSPTSYTRTAKNFSGTSGRVTSRYKSNPGLDLVEEGALNDTHVVNYGFQSVGTNILDSNLEDLCILKALNKLNQRDLDLGTAWYERGKTAQLVGDLAYTAAHALDAIRKRNWQRLRNELGLDGNVLDGGGNVVDGYLVYRYAVMPAMKDVAGAVDSLSRLPPDQWAVTARATEKYFSRRVTTVGEGSENPFTCSSELERRCRAIITAIPKPLTREQDILWSLGLDNPLSTIHEVIPYSFVLDWALPIGDWLSGLNALKYYSGWNTVVSNKTEEKVAVSGASTTYNGGIITSSASGSYSRLQFRRRVTDAPPIPVLPVKDPRSLTHMADGLSLLASAVRRAEDQRLGRWLRL